MPRGRPCKYSKGKTVKVSWYTPVPLSKALTKAAKLAGQSRSEYLSRLVARDVGMELD